jgi:hypothetical protein
MFQAYRKKQTTTNFREKMNRPATGNNYGIFKHQDTRYMKWLKDELDRRETRDKLISYRNDILEANKRINYRNQIDRINNEIQRDNLNHNSLEHLQHQINQFKNLSFT